MFRMSALLIFALACVGPTDTEGEFDTDVGRDTDSGADTDTGEDSDTDTGKDSDPDTGRDSDTDTGEDTDTDSGGDTGTARTVTLAFTGSVATVAGTPLGLDGSARGTSVEGTLSWALDALDVDADATRGDYYPEGAFSMDVGGKVVTGSGAPELQVEDMSSDTFRYVDGSAQVAEVPPVMFVDGVPTPELGLWLSITDGDGASFSSDLLVSPFPMLTPADLFITFSLDDGGTLLMELDSITQE